MNRNASKIFKGLLPTLAICACSRAMSPSKLATSSLSFALASPVLARTASAASSVSWHFWMSPRFSSSRSVKMESSCWGSRKNRPTSSWSFAKMLHRNFYFWELATLTEVTYIEPPVSSPSEGRRWSAPTRSLLTMTPSVAPSPPTRMSFVLKYIFTKLCYKTIMFNLTCRRWVRDGRGGLLLNLEPFRACRLLGLLPLRL